MVQWADKQMATWFLKLTNVSIAESQVLHAIKTLQDGLTFVFNSCLGFVFGLVFQKGFLFLFLFLLQFKVP